MSEYDTYIERVRAVADARKPLTKAEKQCLGVYLGLVLIAALVANFVH